MTFISIIIYLLFLIGNQSFLFQFNFLVAIYMILHLISFPFFVPDPFSDSILIPFFIPLFFFIISILVFLLLLYSFFILLNHHLFCSSSVIKGGCNLFILFKPHYLIMFPKSNLYFTLCEDCFNQELRLFSSIEEYKEFLEDIDPNAKLYRCVFLRKTAI